MRAIARTAIAICLLSVLLLGCGSSAPMLTSDVSLRTREGVRYAVEVTVHGGRECTIQTYGVLAAHVKPFTQTTRSCAQSHPSVRPILIQVAKPVTALLVDRPMRGCPGRPARLVR